MDESSIITGCRSGDRTAQRELYEQFVNRIHSLLLRMTGNEHDAFDLTQETFIRAFDRIATFDGRARIGTWLYRIATNEALQLFRRRRLETRHDRDLRDSNRSAVASHSEFERVDLDDALQRISDQHRTVLVLKYHQGMSYDEIAEVLECSPGTVASRLNRARAELRDVLEGRNHAATEEPPTLGHQKQ